MQNIIRANTPQELVKILEISKTEINPAVNVQIFIIDNSMINSCNNSSNATLTIGGQTQ